MHEPGEERGTERKRTLADNVGSAGRCPEAEYLTSDFAYSCGKPEMAIRILGVLFAVTTDE
jgi:hypothetical protein